MCNQKSDQSCTIAPMNQAGSTLQRGIHSPVLSVVLLIHVPHLPEDVYAHDFTPLDAQSTANSVKCLVASKGTHFVDSLMALWNSQALSTCIK